MRRTVMPMPERYYDSPLSGQQLDAAFQKMQGIEQTASRVQSNASAAAQSASQASSSASAASSSATRAGQSATQAQNSASAASSSDSAASSSASAAAESARQAADSAASIEGDADAAAQSASNAQGHATAAQGSASAAAASASAAKDSEDAAETSAGTAQSASAAADQSERNAKTSETNAASSASAAQQAAALIEDNFAAIQAAPSNAQAAQNAAAQAAQSASDAEDAAARAEQIADFNPADFATAAQGEKADTAVQPDALDAYALKTDIPDELPNPQALTIQLGSSGSPTTYDGSTPQALTVTPEAVGAAPEPLTGNLDDVTPAQVREAIQAGRQVSLLKDDNILSAWVDTGLNVQCLYGWNIGSYTGRSRAISLDGYYGDPNGDNTWNVEKLYGNVLPEVTTAQNGKTVIVQNGQWQLGEASAGGGEYRLIANTGLTSMNQGTSYNSMAAAQYDLLGIVCLCRGSTAADEYSQIQWFPVPESGQSRKYGLVCMNVAEVGSSGLMGEAQVRVVLIQNTGSGIKITSESQGYYYNWGNKGQDNTCAVPAFLYGMKF